MTRYPGAEWVPWPYPDPQGRATYYKGLNQPIAVVLHSAEGYESTIRAWAAAGMYGRSWTFTICDDGRVLQHLEFEDGGYHAGITAAQAASHPPTWALWRGPDENVNHYSLGIERTGFHGDAFLPAQDEATKKLCRWLAAELGFPFDRDHFPPHADIDLVNRPNDFDTPVLREAFYHFMFKELGPMKIVLQAHVPAGAYTGFVDIPNYDPARSYRDIRVVNWGDPGNPDDDFLFAFTNFDQVNGRLYVARPGGDAVQQDTEVNVELEAN